MRSFSYQMEVDDQIFTEILVDQNDDSWQLTDFLSDLLNQRLMPFSGTLCFIISCSVMKLRSRVGVTRD
jgi:hypothetical protein